MTKKVYVASLVLILLSCFSKKEKIPANIIKKEKMIQLIADIEITQGFIKLKNSSKDSIDIKALYLSNFNHYQVTQNQFNKSLKYYSANPKQLEEIYKKVIVLLSKKQAENLKHYKQPLK